MEIHWWLSLNPARLWMSRYQICFWNEPWNMLPLPSGNPQLCLHPEGYCSCSPITPDLISGSVAFWVSWAEAFGGTASLVQNVFHPGYREQTLWWVCSKPGVEQRSSKCHFSTLVPEELLERLWKGSRWATRWHCSGLVCSGETVEEKWTGQCCRLKKEGNGDCTWPAVEAGVQVVFARMVISDGACVKDYLNVAHDYIPQL